MGTLRSLNEAEIDFRDWGGVGIGNDDTAELQAAINQSKGSSGSYGRALGVLKLPAGVFNVDALSIDRSIVVKGAGSRATQIQAVAGVTTGIVQIAVAHDGSNYYTSGGLPPIVSLSGIGIRGPSKVDSGGAPGVLIRNAATNPITTQIDFDDVSITNVATDGISADAVNGAFIGWLSMRRGQLYNVGRDGLSTNSCTDWVFDDVEIGVNTRYGTLLSGCAQFRFDKVYTYSNGSVGLYNFNSDFIYDQGMIDRNLGGGYYHDIRDDNYVATITNTAFLLNSGGSPATTSDVKIGAATTQDARIFDCVFDTPQSGAAGSSKHNIEFEHATNGAEVHSRDNKFKAGTIASANVTNQTGRVY